MTLYAITGRSIYKGQVRNTQMRDALSNDAEVTLVTSDHPGLGTLTKRTAISQTTERADGLTSTDALVSPSSTTLAAAAAPTDTRRSSISDVEAPRRKLHTPIHIPGFGDGTATPGCAISSAGPTLPPECQVITTVTAASPSRPASPFPLAPIALAEPVCSHSGIQRSALRVSTASTVSSAITCPATAPQNYNRASARFHLAAFTPRMSITATTARTNRGARTYARVAFLLYVAMLIVWVPSTVNRVYGLVAIKNNGGVNFALNLAAAAVLPLQGLFNAFVFCFTSRVELGRRFRLLLNSVRQSRKRGPQHMVKKEEGDGINRLLYV
jgi:hypothetical protein